ncbi:MAG: phosphatidate cytidylyltransferase, partial [Spirochaetota bacterium]
MSNFGQRLLLFVIGLPLLLGIVIFFDRYSHAGWAAVVVAVTFLAGRETIRLFAPAAARFYMWIVPVL